MENIPLKIEMVSSRSLERLFCIENPPQHPSAARCIGYHGKGSPFHVCQDGEQASNMFLWSEVKMKWTSKGLTVAARAQRCMHVPGTQTGAGGLKMLRADRGLSHNMNHLVTTAELEMSLLISVPHTLVLLLLWQQSYSESLIKNRS